MNLQIKKNAAKTKNYGTPGRLLSDAEKAIFDSNKISTESILAKAEGLMNHAVNGNKKPSEYNEIALNALLNARWKPSNNEYRVAYEAINENNDYAKKAIDALRKANNDLTKARAVASKQFSGENTVINNTSLTTPAHIWAIMSALNYLEQTGATGTEKTRVLNGLKRIRDHSDKAVYSVLKTRIDSAITSLEGNLPKPSNADIESLRRQIAAAKTEKTEAEGKFQAKTKLHSDFLKNVLVPSSIEHTEQVKKSNGIKEVIKDVKLYKKELDIATSDAYDIASLIRGYGRVIETAVEDNQRKYITSINHFNTLQAVAEIFATYLTDIEEAKLNSLLTVPQIAAIKALKKSVSDWKDFKKIRTDLASIVAREFGFEDYGDLRKKSVEISKTSNRGSSVYADWHVAYDKRWVKHEKFEETKKLDIGVVVNLANVLVNVFPISGSTSSDPGYEASILIDKTKNSDADPAKNLVKEVNLKKIHSIRWSGLSKGAEQGKTMYSIAKDETDNPITLSLAFATDGSRKEGMVKFAWSLFNNDISKLAIVADSAGFDKIAWMNDYKYYAVNDLSSFLNYKKYLEAIKKIVEEAKNTETGESLGLKFDSVWESTTYEVFDGARFSYKGQIEKISKTENKDWEWYRDKYKESYDLILYDKFSKLEEEKAVEKFETLQSNRKKVERLRNEKEIAEAELDEKNKNLTMLKEQLRIAEGLDLDGLKKKFKAIYGDGPRTGSTPLLYSVQELKSMEYYLLLILNDSELDSAVKTEFKDYGKKIEQNVTMQIDSYLEANKSAKSDYEKWILLEGTAENRRDELFVSLSQEDKTNSLKGLKKVYEFIGKYRKLSKPEEVLLGQINKILTGEEEKPEKPTDLDSASLQTILGVTGLSETDIKLEEWKRSRNFNNQARLEELVKDYRPNGQYTSSFKDFLNAGTVDKFEGDDYWTNFIKDGPKTVIRNILYYTDYHLATEADKKKITDKIKSLHADYGLDRPTAKQIANYLYDNKEATVKSKSTTTTTTTGNDESFFETTAGKITLLVGTFAVVGIILAVVFWDGIKAWWENTGESEINKSNKRKNK